MKTFKWITALCLALVCAFSLFLVGCDEKETPGGTTGGTTDGGDITGDTDPDDIVTQKMTEDEWKAAFAESNFANFSVSGTMSETEGTTTDTSALEAKVDGKKQYSKMTYGEGEEKEVSESYVTEENGKTYYYSYDKTTETWSRFESSHGASNPASTFLLFKDSFASFTYDKEENAYTADSVVVTVSERSQTLKNVVIKFVDGKIAYLKMETDNMGSSSTGGEPAVVGTTTAAMTFFAYGTTTITLPTVAAEPAA